VSCINEILPFLNNKTLYELALLLREINTSKPTRVKLICDVCGKEYTKVLHRYLEACEKESGSYCSVKCLGKANGIREIGKGNPRYCSVIKVCEVCGKEYECPPRKLKRKDRFGDTHFYCSAECAYKGRSLFYTGDRNCSYEYQHDPANAEKIQINGEKAREMSMRANAKRYSKIHKKINYILDNNNFGYVNEKKVNKYYYDIYLIDFNLYIEIMGYYWHSNPHVYTEIDKLYDAQIQHCERDAIKNDIIRKNNSSVLYLWEVDIKNRPQLCEDLIKLFIQRDGNLENYNSFNYNDDLTLKDEIAFPYFEKKSA